MGGDKLYFHVFTFRESSLGKPINVWPVKPSPWKCGAGYGVHLADLFQEEGRVGKLCGRETRMPGGRLGSSPFWAPRSLSARTAGTGGKGAGKGGSRAGAA